MTFVDIDHTYRPSIQEIDTTEQAKAREKFVALWSSTAARMKEGAIPLTFVEFVAYNHGVEPDWLLSMFCFEKRRMRRNKTKLFGYAAIAYRRCKAEVVQHAAAP